MKKKKEKISLTKHQFILNITEKIQKQNINFQKQ